MFLRARVLALAEGPPGALREKLDPLSCRTNRTVRSKRAVLVQKGRGNGRAMSESKSYAPTNRPHDQHANIRPHSKNAQSLK